MIQGSEAAVLAEDGRIRLPKPMQERHGWSAGDRLVLEERPDGVLITRERERVFKPTRIEDVYGMLKYDGPPVSIEDMDRAVHEAAAARYRRAVSDDRD